MIQEGRNSIGTSLAAYFIYPTNKMGRKDSRESASILGG